MHEKVNEKYVVKIKNQAYLCLIFKFTMAEKEGFEPSHACTSAGFRNQFLQPLGYFSKRCLSIIA